MSKEDRTGGNGTASWTSREAYLLALVCLLSGLALGYLFGGSARQGGLTTSGSAPAPRDRLAAGNSSALISAVPHDPSANPQAAASGVAMPPAEALDPVAAPLLAALKADPKNVETLVELGNLYYDHQIYSEAIEYYSRALELRPNDFNVRTDLGTAYWYSGFPEKAVAQYQKALSVEPSYAPTLLNLGIVRMEGLKDFDGATAAWERLLATNPQHPEKQRVLSLIAKAKSQKR